MSSKKKIGLPAGSLVYTGDKSQDLKIEVIEYSTDLYSQKEMSLDDFLKFQKKKDSKIWVNVIGINNSLAI